MGTFLLYGFESVRAVLLPTSVSPCDARHFCHSLPCSDVEFWLILQAFVSKWNANASNYGVTQTFPGVDPSGQQWFAW